MRYNIVTLFESLVAPVFQHGVVSRAVRNGLVESHFVNPRDFTNDTHRTVDDKPFGGGDGMVLMAEPLAKSILSLGEDAGEVIYLSPQGEKLNDKMVRQLCQRDRLTLVCGRYGGVDQRFINRYVSREVSIGDYVLSGGEPAAAVLIDAVTRQIPGVLGHEQSKDRDSFANGEGLEAPIYTQPRDVLGQSVPEVLVSGDHARIESWREMVGLLVTAKKRPDLLGSDVWEVGELDDRLKSFYQSLTQEQRVLLGLEEDPERVNRE